MLKWPGRAEVDAAARALAARIVAAHPELVRFGYFGSYARGDFGPGSDLDLVAIVRTSERPFAERPLDFDLTGLPVPAEIVVYTDDEWRDACARGGRFFRNLLSGTVWLLPSRTSAAA
ncbi:MAG: nucleotidyltransferase domain-containing protein [Betaproteobacteria bacterium]|nr:nucleotidyltransferase domain-containing protein [Betaproteobacteria bacterium]